MKAKGNFGDDPQCAEGSRHEFMKIIPSDIFYDFSAGASDRAIGQYDGHADDEVAETAVSQAETAGIVCGSNTAYCRAIRPERIESDELTMLLQRRLHRRPQAASFGGTCHVLPYVLSDGIEAMRVQDN
jgi:hypothetical protein